MPGVSGSKLRRGIPVNYALLHQKGFSSVTSLRTKRKTKVRRLKSKAISETNSPTNIEENGDATQRLLQLAAVKLHQQIKDKSVKPSTIDKVGTVQQKKRITKKKNKVNKKSAPSDPESVNASPRSLNSSDIIITGQFVAENMSLPNLKGLSAAEKKRILQQKIEEMEAEAQVQEEEEDDELQELLKKHEQLRSRLSTRSSKNSKSKHKNKVDNEDLPVHEQINIEELTKSKMPSVSDIQNLLHISEKKTKTKSKCSGKNKRRKGGHKKTQESSESSSDSETSVSSDSESSSSDSEEGDVRRKKRSKKGKKLKSGLFERPANARIVSSEWYAHAALEDEIGGSWDVKDLSFNLLVAGELEIVLSGEISKSEINTRLEVLKSLAYKHEYLPRREIMSQYSKFMRKVEKGKYKWGSNKALQSFEQHLIYSLSIENLKHEKGKTGKSMKKFDERKKYCLNYNRGNCNFDDSHEGNLGGQTVFKLHVCKKCLVKDGLELKHPEKDCTKN